MASLGSAPSAPFAATTYAEYYGIADPTTSLMSQLAVLLLAKASYAKAEPLMKRALAIDEAGYGPDHPDVARDLNNLAMLLQATNRLEETEPLMRQTLVIFLKFTRSTKHLHPNLKTAIRNYDYLLEAVGLGAPEIDRRHYEIGKEAGLDRAAFGKLLSPLSH